MKTTDQWIKEGDRCRTTLAIESPMLWSNYKFAFSKDQIGKIQQDARVELLERIAELQFKLYPKLPKPTITQADCLHVKWRAMDPQPRNCVECGLLMWSAGD